MRKGSRPYGREPFLYRECRLTASGDWVQWSIAKRSDIV